MESSAKGLREWITRPPLDLVDHSAKQEAAAQNEQQIAEHGSPAEQPRAMCHPKQGTGVQTPGEAFPDASLTLRRWQQHRIGPFEGQRWRGSFLQRCQTWH